MPAEALAEVGAKAGSFGGFRRSFDRRHGCPAYVAKLVRRSRLKPVGLHPPLSGACVLPQEDQRC